MAPANTPAAGSGQSTTPPVSKAVQRLLAQINAKAQASTLAALSAKDGIVVLHDMDRETTRVECDRHNQEYIRITDGKGFTVEMTRMRVEPESWKTVSYMKGMWRPGQWNVDLARTDGQGRRWRCDLGAHITDDFGTLVCVKGGAA